MKTTWKRPAGIAILFLLVISTGTLAVGSVHAETQSTAATTHTADSSWMEYQVNVTLNETGHPVSAIMRFEIGGEAYELAEYNAERGGYSSVAEMYESTAELEPEFNVTAEDLGDRLAVTMEEKNPEIPPEYQPTVGDGVLHATLDIEFEDGGAEFTEADSFDVLYTIDMPGTVVDSNADRVDGNRAIWEFDFLEVEPGDTIDVAAQLEDEPTEEEDESPDEPDESPVEESDDETVDQDDTGGETVTEQAIGMNGQEEENQDDESSNTLPLVLGVIGASALGYWYWSRSRVRRS